MLSRVSCTEYNNDSVVDFCDTQNNFLSVYIFFVLYISLFLFKGNFLRLYEYVGGKDEWIFRKYTIRE